MKKRRYLKPQVENALSMITMIMIMFMCMLDDFTVSLATITFLACWIGIIAMNCHILHKYGRNF